MTWVSIWLKPLVERVWSDTLEWEEVQWLGERVRVFDVGETSVYDMVVGGLCRRQRIAGGELPETTMDAVMCGVKVGSEAVRVNGSLLDRETQRMINRCCERMIRGQLHEVALLDYHLKGRSLPETYQRFIDKYEMLNNELTVEALKKERLRKYKDIENTLIADTLNVVRII